MTLLHLVTKSFVKIGPRLVVVLKHGGRKARI